VQSGGYLLGRLSIGKKTALAGLDVLGTVSGSALQVSGLSNCANTKTDASGNFSCNSTTYLTSQTVTAVGQGLSLNSGLLTLSTTNSGSLAKYTTLSGANVYAKNSLF